MTTVLMPPERIPPGPRRDAYIALLRELGVLPDVPDNDAGEANETADENDATPTATATSATLPSCAATSDVATHTAPTLGDTDAD